MCYVGKHVVASQQDIDDWSAGPSPQPQQIQYHHNCISNCISDVLVCKTKACGPYQRYCRCKGAVTQTGGLHGQWLCGECGKFYSLATRQRLFPKSMQPVEAAVPCAQQPHSTNAEIMQMQLAAVAAMQMAAAGVPSVPQAVGSCHPEPRSPPRGHRHRNGRRQHHSHRGSARHHHSRRSRSLSSSSTRGRGHHRRRLKRVKVWWPGSSVVVRWADVGGLTSSFVCLRVAGC